MTTPPPLLEVRHVTKRFAGIAVLDDVSLMVRGGMTTSLVGESGSGKSTLARIITGLETATSGELLFDGRVRPRRGATARAIRRSIGVVLQDPYDSLDPRFSVGEVVAEPLRAQGRYRRGGRERVRELLDLCGMKDTDPDSKISGYSGGQRQRIAIARALATDAKLIVCDEPTSALDVSVQAQILNLLLRLQHECDLAYLFITHDMDIVRRISDDVVVMQAGKIIEAGDVTTVTTAPREAYTRTLLSAVLSAEPSAARRRQAPEEP